MDGIETTIATIDCQIANQIPMFLFPMYLCCGNRFYNGGNAWEPKYGQIVK